MAKETFTQISYSDLTDENEYINSDVIPIDTDVDESVEHVQSLMPDPYVGEDLSDDSVLKAMEQFVCGFTNRYSTSGPLLYMGSLDQAMAHSLFDPTNPCPLALFIYHQQSVSTNVFCEQVLCTDKIINYLSENFIVWAWDRTSESNYNRLLTMLRTHLNDDVVETVDSSPIDMHPLLICLRFNEGYVEIVTVIEGSMSSNETLTQLMQVRGTFDRRVETPDPVDLCLRTVSNEGWSMSPCILTSVDETSAEFKNIANEFIGYHKQVISIDKIENALWLFQYLNQKKYIDSQFKDGESERLLVFSCPKTAVEQILQEGFNHNHKSIQGRKYGYGYYFSLPSIHKHRYEPSQSSDRNKQTMLVCRVLVGRTCPGNWMMETCPDEYDSTTDGLDTYVVYSNRSILPRYYITY